jgi:hypothetical protein
MHAALTEIIELHDFFADWFAGRLPRTDAAFARFERAMGPAFVLVDPSGAERERAPLVAGLRAAHSANPPIKIWIEHAKVLHEEGALVLARYDECQRDASGETRRLSTVLLRRDAAAPGGWLWLRVHETWAKA